MNGRPIATAGTALTTFLVVAVLVTELLSARIAFSALIGLPVGVVAGGVVGVVTRVRLWDRPGLRPVLLGGSAVGYALLAAAAVSYAVPPARPFVNASSAVGFAVVCGGGVLLLARRYPERISA